MSGVGVLVILLFISSIPAIAVALWIRLAHYPFSLPRFCIALLAGAVSFFPALFFQNLLNAEYGFFYAFGKWRIVAEIFIRVAFTEEFSRLIVLVILVIIFFAINRHKPAGISIDGTAAIFGLIAGLGFAILESATYGASNIENTPIPFKIILLRTFTAAPLHGACGFRVATSIALFHEQHPVLGVFRFLTAVIIHGIYNFMVLIPGTFPSIAAVLIAFSAFASAIQVIYSGMKAEKPLDTTA